jgi:hypothetical protein
MRLHDQTTYWVTIAGQNFSQPFRRNRGSGFGSHQLSFVAQFINLFLNGGSFVVWQGGHDPVHTTRVAPL